MEELENLNDEEEKDGKKYFIDIYSEIDKFWSKLLYYFLLKKCNL